MEAGPVRKIVPIAGSGGAVVALFPDGHAFYSPDGFNLATTPAYSGSLQVMDVVALSRGVDALLSDGSVYFSPDGRNLGGGGASVAAYTGAAQVSSLTAVGGGVDAVFAGASGSDVYFSPDGLDVGGGGSTSRIYSGSDQVAQIVAIGPGDAVVTLFSDGRAFYSVDNRDLGGGGNTIAAAPAGSAVQSLVPVGGGVLVAFGSGSVYLSPDGRNLGGGGATIAVYDWDASAANGPFPPRDSAHTEEFLGRLWLSGGFANATGTDSCFVTCSYYDLWSSTDLQGTSWNSAPSFATATPPDPRDATPVVNNGVQDSPLPTDFYDSYSALLVWNNQLTAIGSTVWRSADGVTWKRQNLADGVTAAPGPLPPPLRATENSRAVALNGSLYFLQLDTGEVFRSTDPNAATWTDPEPISGFVPRCGAAGFAFAGQLWVEGGGACDYSKVYSDVWSSPDGINWTQHTTPAGWSGRMWPCIAVGSNAVWLVGGYAPTDWNSSASGALSVRYSANHADVWYSRNGADWKQLKADAGSGLPDDGKLEPRHAASCYVVGANAASQKLIVTTGTGGSDPNDGNARTLNSIRILALPATSSLP